MEYGGYMKKNIVMYTINFLRRIQIIDDFFEERATKKYDKECKKLDQKYGNYMLEDDDIKFIWGVKSWDDLSGEEASIYTMNDIDIIYDKKEKKYALGIETAYMFKNHAAECRYLQDCLNAFTQYMKDNNLSMNEHFMLFMNNTCCDIKADTIEELYTNFKIFVDGFCAQEEWNKGE